MRDAERLRRQAVRFLLQAEKAERQGKSEQADRLELCAQKGLEDAVVLDAAEARLDAERVDHEREVPRSARISALHGPDAERRQARDKA